MVWAVCALRTGDGDAVAWQVYFHNYALDVWFWLRNQHPILSIFFAHPLHPFDSGARARFFSVVVIFSLFSSVVLLSLFSALPL